jgi:hypothetical protein
MSKRKPIDRRYHYPKGYIDKKTGRSKTGFMPASKGAQNFVKGNLQDIKRGNIPFDSLTARERKVFKSLTSDRKENTFSYEGKKYYDPTGVIRTILDRNPATRSQNKLDNLISKQTFLDTFNQNRIPVKSIDKLNSTLFDFKKGDEKQRKDILVNTKRYQSNYGNLLDIIKNLKRLERNGFKINVDNQTGKQAIEELAKFETKKLTEQLKKYNKGDKVKFEIQYNVQVNPFTKQININTKDSTINEMTNTP